MAMNEIRIQSEALDPGRELELLREDNPAIGGIVSFIGLMRDMNQGKQITSLSLEHYPGMTEKALQSIVGQVNQRWDILGSRIVHRVGEMKPTDVIVVVAVASTHRGEAFQACEFIIDYLKSHAPFWKKERTVEGEHWVEARSSDHEAVQKWRRSET